MSYISQRPTATQPRVIRLTAPLVAGLGRDLLHAVGWKPAHLAAGAALPETPLSDAQNWTDGGMERGEERREGSGKKILKHKVKEQCVPRDHLKHFL